MKARVGSISLFLIIATIGMSQVATGTPPFNSFGGGPFDVVNLGNLNVHFVIPVLHKAGRGIPFDYDLHYDSSLWTPSSVNGVQTWVPDSNWGWRAWNEVAVGYFNSQLISRSICGKPPYIEIVYTMSWSNYVYHDTLGVSHPFYGTSSIDCNGNFHGFNSLASDGSGYTMTVGNGQYDVTITSRSGRTQRPSPFRRGGTGTLTDTNGNEITLSSDGTQFFDTLSSTTPALTVSSPAPPASATFTYAAPSGGNAVYSMNFAMYTVATSFGVSNASGTIAEYGPLAVPLVGGITLPDQSSYTFAYEKTSGSCTPLSGTYSANCVTGRIASVTLATGGIITYMYTGGPAGTGIYSDGSTAGLTRTLSATTTAPAQTWSYSRALQTGSPGPGSTWSTIVIDSNENNTVINFAEDGATNNGTTVATYNAYETQRAVYQGGVSPNNLLTTTVRCYSATYTKCGTATVSSPITQLDVYSQLPNGSTRLSEILYNTFGLVTSDKEYDYGVIMGAAPGNAHLIRTTGINYGTYTTLGCKGLGNIEGLPCQMSVSDWTSGTPETLALTTYSYDQATPATTSGTPQHVAVTGSRGNLTTATTSVNGSATLSNISTYYDTGTPNVVTDVNGAQTTYVYGTTAQGSFTVSCGNSFPTTINEPLSLSRMLTWNCTGGMPTQITDENGNNVTANYTDPNFWRPVSVVDEMSNQTNLTYIGQTAVEAALQNFNSGNSASDSLATVDGFGRAIFSQRKQGPNATSYDTTEIDYNSLGQPYRSTMPYSTTASPSSSNTTAPSTTTTYDALGRVLTTTDAGGGKVSYTYTNNDVFQTVGGTPTGTQSFQKQFEYDGLSRLTSVCEITAGTTAWPGGTCLQGTAQTHPTGYWTKYAYDALGHLLTATQNAQAASGSQQMRSFTYDMLGRMLTESNPETGHNGVNGNVTYSYDSASSSTCGSTPALGCGDLVKKLDNAGNTTNYTYDALHRLLAAGNGTISGATLRSFVYDMKSSFPSGVSVVNGNGKMIEATTTNTSGTTLTDEFFSYDARGELTDVYESTPHSGGYYHTTAAYWPTGMLKTLSGIPGVSTINYGAGGTGLDSEGNITKVTAASGQNPVAGVTYAPSTTNSNYTGPLRSLTGVTFGSGDSDSFGSDMNTGRMTGYSYAVDAKTDVGVLTWSANGTLTKFVINDLIPGTSDTQTCTYAYDDLARVAGVTAGVKCVNGSTTVWSQTFAYDPFGNITKSGTSSFAPNYMFGNGAITNQFSSIPGVSVSYDANGNLLTDNLNTYTWDANWGNPASVNTTKLVYDALGEMVEQQSGSTFTEMVYSPVGKAAIMNGRTLIKAFVYLPGGGTAIYNSSGLAYYRHSDWLGSSRLTSTQSQGLYSSSAYAPFGEQYATSGTADASFTGQNANTVASLYDFTFREDSQSQGRWISPDPAGIGVVDFTNPQTWNRYAYVLNNPLIASDPFGLDCVYDNGDGTVTVLTGDCTSVNDNGYYIDGTINTNQPIYLDQSTGTLSFSFSTGADGTGLGPGGASFGFISNFEDPISSPSLSASWAAALGLGYDFVFGVGPQNRTYGPGTTTTGSFLKSKVINRMMENVLENCGANSSGHAFVSTSRAADNAPSDLINSPTAFQLGAFTYDWQVQGQIVDFSVQNPVTLNSLFYHVPAAVGIDNPSSGYFGTINQTLNFSLGLPFYAQCGS